MLCGTDKIGYATAEKMKEFRTVIWLLHGVYGAGKTLDETFGLIETVEKAAQIYNIIGSREIKNTLTEDNFKELIDLFAIEPRYDFFREEKYRKLAKK
jgi:rhamnulose-1-phosphate aldolase